MTRSVGLELYNETTCTWECVNLHCEGDWMHRPDEWTGPIPDTGVNGIPPDISENWFRWISCWADWIEGEQWVELVPGKVRLLWFKWKEEVK